MRRGVAPLDANDAGPGLGLGRGRRIFEVGDELIDIDCQRRRDALRTWCIDLDTWQWVIGQLPPPRPHGIQPALGDRKRQTASIIVWAPITQAEYIFASHPSETSSRRSSSARGV